MAPSVDHLLYFLLAVAVFFTVGIFVTHLLFRDPVPAAFGIGGAGAACTARMALEIAWTVIPFGLTMIMFVWGASVFFKMSRPPDDAQQIYVVGKQWMWKLQHMEGQREINELHIPVGQAVKLTMTSEDVIHEFLRPGLPHQGGRAAGPLHDRPGSSRPSPVSTTCSAPSIAAPSTPP